LAERLSERSDGRKLSEVAITDPELQYHRTLSKNHVGRKAATLEVGLSEDLGKTSAIAARRQANDRYLRTTAIDHRRANRTE
jgi:hypothetical protein